MGSTTMTSYKPEGHDPDYSTKYFYTEDYGSNERIRLRFKDSNGKFGWWNISKDYAIKAVCQAYIGDLTETSDERVAMIAHLAGYELADKSDDIWRQGQPYDDTGFAFDYAPFKIIQPNTSKSDELAKLKAAYAELGKEIEAMEAGKG